MCPESESQLWCLPVSGKHTLISFFTEWALPLLGLGGSQQVDSGNWKFVRQPGGGGCAQTWGWEMGGRQPNTAVTPWGTPGEKMSLLCVVIC